MSTDNAAEAAPALVLVGVSGSGKSTVGRIVADRFGFVLRDVDDLVETALGAPMNALVVRDDPRLDAVRRDVALDALRTNGALVVLGASQILDGPVAEALADARSRGATVVELTADIAEVARREGLNAPRSVALGAPRAMLAQMIARLHSLYGAVVDHSVDTRGRTPDEVAGAVASTCRLAGDSRTQK